MYKADKSVVMELFLGKHTQEAGGSERLSMLKRRAKKVSGMLYTLGYCSDKSISEIWRISFQMLQIGY